MREKREVDGVTQAPLAITGSYPSCSSSVAVREELEMMNMRIAELATRAKRQNLENCENFDHIFSGLRMLTGAQATASCDATENFLMQAPE